jgi:hypothetical protein
MKFSKKALSKARQRPKSAWSHFVQASMGEDLGGSGKGKLTERVREFGEKWKNMGEEEKKPFIEQYIESKQRSQEHRKNLSADDKAQIQYWRKVRRQASEGRTRTPSTYAKFVRANKEAFSSYEGEKKAKLSTVSKQLSEKWKTMTAEQKAIYQHSGSVYEPPSSPSSSPQGTSQ